MNKREIQTLYDKIRTLEYRCHMAESLVTKGEEEIKELNRQRELDYSVGQDDMKSFLMELVNPVTGLQEYTAGSITRAEFYRRFPQHAPSMSW